MKILNDNYNKTNIKNNANIVKPYPRDLICENCESKLKYEEFDLRMGAYGCVYIDCPLCGYDNMLEDNENNTTLTKDNIEFPLHFYHVCEENGAVNCCDNVHIKKYINEAVNYFRTHKDEYDYGGHIIGNLYFHVHRWSGDELYEISIANDFYSMEIPFEEEDY